MTRSFGSIVAGTVALGSLAVSSTAVLAQQVNAYCYRDSRDVVCDVRPGEVKQISSVTATVGGKAVQTSGYEPYDAGAGTAAWYFLIQQSVNAKDSAQVIDRITQQGGSRRIFGVGMFSDNFKELAGLGATSGDIGKIKSQKFETGSKTDLYRSIQEAVAKLGAQGVKADRKAIVVFGNGSSSWQSGRDQLVKSINDSNILLYLVHMTKGRSAGDYKELEKLRDETGGVLLNAVDCGAARSGKSCDNVDLEESTIRDFFLHLERGATVKLPSSAVPNGSDLVLSVNFVDGKTAQSKPLAVRQGAPLPPSAAVNTPIWERAVQMAVENPVISGAAGALGLGVLLLGGAMLTRRDRSAMPSGYSDDATAFDPTGRSTGMHTAMGNTGHGMLNGGGSTVAAVPAGSDTVILTPSIDSNPPQHIYAWLQFLDSDSKRVPIGSTNVRIGRHKDNDIILQNKTVHRQHAVLHMTSDKRFSIRDLGGENGTMVNGQRCNQKDLGDGDMIELGEVRLRFFANA